LESLAGSRPLPTQALALKLSHSSHGMAQS